MRSHGRLCHLLKMIPVDQSMTILTTMYFGDIPLTTLLLHNIFNKNYYSFNP